MAEIFSSYQQQAGVLTSYRSANSYAGQYARVHEWGDVGYRDSGNLGVTNCPKNGGPGFLDNQGPSWGSYLGIALV